MSKKRLALIIGIAIVAVIVVTIFSILYLPMILPRATTLAVSPSTFTLNSGESIALVALLTSDELTLTGSNIVWKADAGLFDKTVGPSVIYRVPEVDSETTVTITVEFPGEGPYQPSKVTIIGKILPKLVTKTTLAIVPSMFELVSGDKINLRVEITPKDAPVEIIKWSLEGPGTLTPTTGPSVTYTSPEVDVETTIKIVAEFSGTEEYGRSSVEVVGKIFPKGSVVKKATILTVTPSTFTVAVGGEITLTAELKDVDGEILSDKTVNWILEGPGYLSSTTGLAVTYKAPVEIKEEVTVRIKAKFLGDKDYLPASVEVVGTVTTAPSITEYAYKLEFERFVFKNVKIEGPITTLGAKVTKISGEVVEIEGLLLHPMGLKSERSTFQRFEIYTLDIAGQSPELGERLQILGEQQVSLTKDTLTLEKGQAKIVYITANLVRLVKPELVGKYVGGAEPYVPVIVTAHSVILKEGYFLEGPKTYEELADKTNKLTAGKVEASDFTFTYPSEYSLNRKANEYTFTGVWKLSSSKLTGQKILIYLIYFEAKYGGIAVKGTGEDTASQIIPHGFNAGYESPPLPDAKTHAAYFYADSLDIENLVLQITP